jgi:aspartate ammonia-lyase
MRLGALELTKTLCEELDKLADAIDEKATRYADFVKPGRTHLQDAVPITFGQEFSGWAARVRGASARLRSGRAELCELGIGGTAAGTGLNADPKFRERVCAYLADWYGEPITPAKNLFYAMQSMAPFVRISSGMRTAAIEVSSICNDIRLLVSGPRTGFGEISIPAVQPGSSIMPGKVNPAIAEMVNQVCFQVIGNDTAVAWGAQAGQLELNVMMPGINYAVCFSATILANAVRVLRERTITGLEVDEKRARELMDASPSLLVTALSPHIGYGKAAALVKRALAERRSLVEVALEEKVMSEKDLRRVLDPLQMTKGGVQELRGETTTSRERCGELGVGRVHKLDGLWRSRRIQGRCACLVHNNDHTFKRRRRGVRCVISRERSTKRTLEIREYTVEIAHRE